VGQRRPIPTVGRDIAPEAKSLEGYPFPDTYKFIPARRRVI